jgi:transcription elongation GreA/GreB family factor
MPTPDELDKLRTELTALRAKRDAVIAELGAYAQENNDLRENSAYLHTEQKIHVLDAQIMVILAEFTKLNLAKKKANYLLTKPRRAPKVDL